MTLRKAMWWLAAIWFAGAGLSFVVLVIQSQLGTYEPDTGDVWGWFLPTVMPTLALIVGALVADYRKTPVPPDPAMPKPTVGPIFLLGAILSVFYLLLVATSIVVPALQVETAPLTLMQRSNFYLGPLQGLCVAALGFFFQSKS
jgi:hypothetical protein